MKKSAIRWMIRALALLMCPVFTNAQSPRLTFRFANEIVIPGDPFIAQFDVEMTCNQSGTYHSDLQVYFDYSAAAFGNNIFSNGKISWTRLELLEGAVSGVPKYDIVNEIDNTSTRYALLTEANFLLASSSYMNEIPSGGVWKGLIRFQIIIDDTSQVADLNFTKPLMNGFQYYVDATYSTPTKYYSPNLYSNNLLSWDMTPPTITVWLGEEDSDWFNFLNWTDGVPNEYFDGRVPAGTKGNNPRIAGDTAKVIDLTIVLGGQLTVDTTGFLTVTGNMTLNGTQCFRVECGKACRGSVITGGTISGTGTAKIEQYLEADRWHLVSSPVSNATAVVYLNIYLKAFLEPFNSWQYITSTTYPLTKGKGFSAWSSGSLAGNTTVSFTGTPNTGDMSFTGLTYTPAQGKGWNLVGNPYPSAVDWDGTWSKSNVDATIYLYDGIQYLTWNYNLGGYGTKGNGIIPSTQGFWIKANAASPSLAIPNAARLHDTEPFYKASAGTAGFTLTGAAYSDRMLVLLCDQATAGFDTEYDAHKLKGDTSAPQLYSWIFGCEFAVNVLPPSPNIRVFLGMDFPSAGSYQFAADDLSGLDPGISVYLKDLGTSPGSAKMINLRTNPQYNFTANHGIHLNRFVLYFTEGSKPDEEGLIAGPPSKGFLISSLPQTIVIGNPEGLAGTLEVFGLAGQLAYSGHLEANRASQQHIQVKEGMYLVRITSPDGRFSGKVVVSR